MIRLDGSCDSATRTLFGINLFLVCYDHDLSSLPSCKAAQRISQSSHMSLLMYLQRVHRKHVLEKMIMLDSARLLAVIGQTFIKTTNCQGTHQFVLVHHRNLLEKLACTSPSVHEQRCSDVQCLNYLLNKAIIMTSTKKTQLRCDDPNIPLHDGRNSLLWPNTLGAVCKSWRWIARRTPRLWTNIIASLDLSDPFSALNFDHGLRARVHFPLVYAFYQSLSLNIGRKTSHKTPGSSILYYHIVKVISECSERWKNLDIVIPMAFATDAANRHLTPYDPQIGSIIIIWDVSSSQRLYHFPQHVY